MSNHELAGELAREIDVVLGSHEAVLAPVIMDAYLAGGRQRAELFQPGETGVASFGGGGFLVSCPMFSLQFSRSPARYTTSWTRSG